VENRNLTRFVHFSPDHVNRETVFETGHLWAEVLCLDRNQAVGPITDLSSDAVFTIIAGEGVFLVDGKRKRLEQWGTVLSTNVVGASFVMAAAQPHLEAAHGHAVFVSSVSTRRRTSSSRSSACERCRRPK